MSVAVAPGLGGADVAAVAERAGAGTTVGAGAEASGEALRASDPAASPTPDGGTASVFTGGIWFAADSRGGGATGKAAIAAECGISGSIGTDAALPSAGDDPLKKLGTRLYNSGLFVEPWSSAPAFGIIASVGCTSRKKPMPKKTPTVAVAMAATETR